MRTDGTSLRRLAAEAKEKSIKYIEHQILIFLLFMEELRVAVGGQTSAQPKNAMPGYFNRFDMVIRKMAKMNDPSSYSALKVLHEPKEARDPENARERIKNEIIGMQNSKHPNLLPIVDVDQDHTWFVSKYYSRGTLSKYIARFAGNALSALKAIRPVVNAVSMLHDKGHVHRDIKPDNIFIYEEGNLILGDFGLVYFSDEQRTRLTNSFSNVGSRDWMPGWAMAPRLDDVKPAFDV